MHRRGLIAGAVLAGVLVMGSVASAAGDEPTGADPTARQGTFSMTEVYFAVGLAAAAAVTASISILGAGFAVGKIGAAALGSAAEHPELLTRSLLFVALAEGLAVLGFAVAMLIVMKIP
ncbi:MAG: ATP synthase subunit C [Pirellulaceae bacterium]|jgi:V/A-type H+-transporting ATPase subunit K|nr:ATP synthase subunit C [Pirellulaceae bacterium]